MNLLEKHKYCPECDDRVDVRVMAFRGVDAEYCDRCGIRLG